MLELRSLNTDPSKHFIKVYLKNNTASEEINPRPLPIYGQFKNYFYHINFYYIFFIKGCDLLCPLDNFLNIVKDMVVEDITTACKSRSINFLFLFKHYNKDLRIPFELIT